MEGEKIWFDRIYAECAILYINYSKYIFRHLCYCCYCYSILADLFYFDPFIPPMNLDEVFTYSHIWI